MNNELFLAEIICCHEIYYSLKGGVPLVHIERLVSLKKGEFHMDGDVQQLKNELFSQGEM